MASSNTMVDVGSGIQYRNEWLMLAVACRDTTVGQHCYPYIYHITTPLKKMHPQLDRVKQRPWVHRDVTKQRFTDPKITELHLVALQSKT